MKQNLICRCCLSEECYKDMRNVYYINNKPENYGDMLANIFNINISNTDAERCLICEECVSKLRDAAAFKEQVMNSQEAIIQKLTGLKRGLKTDIVQPKIENEFDDFDDRLSNDFVWDSGEYSPTQGQAYVIKLESNAKDKIPIKDKAKHTKSNDINTRRLNKVKTSQVKRIKTKVITANQSKETSKPKFLENTQTQEIATHTRENTLKLIQNSNLCLFRSLQNKYGCSLCNTSFPEIKELRNHYLTHCDLKSLIFKVQRFRGLSYKNADISNLKCNVCLQNCTDLIELMTHLNDEHEISFQGNEHFLIPFKLLDGFKCVICELKFNSMREFSGFD